MYLQHPDGWCVAPLPRQERDGLRLFRLQRWVGDYRLRDLELRLSLHGTDLDEFLVYPGRLCSILNVATRTGCLEPATHTLTQPDGSVLPLCASCHETLLEVRSLPVPVAGTAHPGGYPDIPGLDELWLGLGTDEDRRAFSHRLREPIARVLGYAELLSEFTATDALWQHCAGIILDSAQDLRQLLTEISWAV